MSEIYEKLNIFAIIIDLHVRREIRLNEQFLDLRPLVKGIYIYTCKAVFDFTYTGLKLTCQGRWITRDRVRAALTSAR